VPEATHYANEFLEIDLLIAKMKRALCGPLVSAVECISKRCVLECGPRNYFARSNAVINYDEK